MGEDEVLLNSYQIIIKISPRISAEGDQEGKRKKIRGRPTEPAGQTPIYRRQRTEAERTLPLFKTYVKRVFTPGHHDRVNSPG